MSNEEFGTGRVTATRTASPSDLGTEIGAVVQQPRCRPRSHVDDGAGAGNPQDRDVARPLGRVHRTLPAGPAAVASRNAGRSKPGVDERPVDVRRDVGRRAGRHERDRRTTEAPAGHPGAERAGLPRRLHGEVELGAGDGEVVAQRAMRAVEQGTDAIDVTGAQRVRDRVDPVHLRDDVAGEPEGLVAGQRPQRIVERTRRRWRRPPRAAWPRRARGRPARSRAAAPRSARRRCGGRPGCRSRAAPAPPRRGRTRGGRRCRRGSRGAARGRLRRASPRPGPYLPSARRRTRSRRRLPPRRERRWCQRR